MIEVSHLLRKFQTGDTELIAVNNLSFSIPSGQFLAITGKSGSGKSTLLYQLSLLDKPSGGDVIIDGLNIGELTDKERVNYRLQKFGFIFQDYALLPSLTALENVMLPLLMQGMDKEQAVQLGIKALRQVDLDGKFANLPNQLSGGQQQRVSIARSIVHNPTILFADEPTANLDSESSQTVLNTFLSLSKQTHLTIIMVTHEEDYAALADRCITLFDGKIIKDKMQKTKSSKTTKR